MDFLPFLLQGRPSNGLVVVWAFGAFCMPSYDGLRSSICSNVLQVGRFLIEFERVINTDGEVHIGGTLV